MTREPPFACPHCPETFDGEGAQTERFWHVVDEHEPDRARGRISMSLLEFDNREADGAE